MSDKLHRSSTKALSATVVAAVLVLACAPANDEHHPAGEIGAGDTRMAPTIDELSAATFEGLYDHPVTLANGRWEGEPFVEGGASRPTVVLDRGLRLTGDLDGDGGEEAVVLLSESSGGSGTRLYLAVAAHSAEGISTLGTILIGDRVQVRAARLMGERIVLDVLQAGPGDALCCPTQKARKSWRLAEGRLVPVAVEVTGTFSLADLDGSKWILAEIEGEEPALPDAEITLLFKGNKVVGEAGCNSYFGGVSEGEAPGSLTFSAMGATRMVCPEAVMELESRYLGVLAETSRYGFSAGRLVLSTDTAEQKLILVFSPSEPEAAEPEPASDEAA